MGLYWDPKKVRNWMAHFFFIEKNRKFGLIGLQQVLWSKSFLSDLVWLVCDFTRIVLKWKIPVKFKCKISTRCISYFLLLFLFYPDLLSFSLSPFFPLDSLIRHVDRVPLAATDSETYRWERDNIQNQCATLSLSLSLSLDIQFFFSNKK